MLLLTVGFCVNGVTVPVLFLVLMNRTVFTPAFLLAFSLIIIGGIIFQAFPLPQVLTGLLPRLAATIELKCLDPGVLAGAFIAVPAVKISWHNNLI